MQMQQMQQLQMHQMQEQQMQMQQPDMAADAVMPDAATIPQVQQAPAAAAAAVAAAVVDTATGHHIPAASPLDTSRMQQVTSETASMLEREAPTEPAIMHLAYRIFTFYHASTDQDVRSHFANLLKALHRKLHAFTAIRGLESRSGLKHSDFTKIINKH